jgi:hypothetical protein
LKAPQIDGELQKFDFELSEQDHRVPFGGFGAEVIWARIGPHFFTSVRRGSPKWASRDRPLYLLQRFRGEWASLAV